MNSNWKRTLAAAAAVVTIGLAGDEGGCSDNSNNNQPSAAGNAVDQQRDQANSEIATEQTYSYEVDNIKKRRVLFGKPGVIGYVVFMNQAGQPIHYLAVSGKCTSSGKRISPVETLVDSGDGNGNGWSKTPVPAIGEDGVYGTSENYIYCFDTAGRYWQWSGDYLYSDKPFDLTIKPLVVDTNTAHVGHQ